MANDVLIDQHFEHYKVLVDDIFKQLHGLTKNIGNDKLSDTVDDIRSRLHEPFLFVIVGEVKVGKSSFVNALLQTDKEVCKVAPDPCTDTIQQIVYSETESVIPINEHLKKITLPIEILKKIAIVDTPGTNTVIQDHTEITEKFIPISDLVIFVFEAKNPYRKSAWEFFDYISKEWRKKVIFVLQQKDLMEDDDMVVNLNGVKNYAVNRGITNPNVFAVSAKMEQKGMEDSGFTEMREYIKETITGGNNMRMKIRSLLDTSKHIMNNIKDGASERQKQLDVDQKFRRKVDSLLDGAENKSDAQVDAMIDDVLREYDKITGNIQEEFEEGLGLFTLLKRSFRSIFSEKEGLKQWIESITEKLKVTLQPALESKMRNGVANIAESIKQMAEIIDVEIQKNKAGLKSNSHIFGDIASRRQDKMDKLHANITELVAETEAYVNNDMLRESSSLVPNLATGGGIAVIGVILLSVAHGAVVDITGGILTGLGVLGGGLYTLAKKRKIIKEFANEIYKGRTALKENMEEKLGVYIKEIRTKIDNNFLEFDSYLSEEEKGIEEVVGQYQSINEKFVDLEKKLEI